MHTFKIRAMRLLLDDSILGNKMWMLHEDLQLIEEMAAELGL